MLHGQLQAGLKPSDEILVKAAELGFLVGEESFFTHSMDCSRACVVLSEVLNSILYGAGSTSGACGMLSCSGIYVWGLCLGLVPWAYDMLSIRHGVQSTSMRSLAGAQNGCAGVKRERGPSEWDRGGVHHASDDHIMLGGSHALSG